MKKRFLAIIISVIMTIMLIPAMVRAGERKTATEIFPGATSNTWINSGGTYILKGGEYNTDQSSIIINTTDPVTLKLDGDVTFRGSKTLIQVIKSCSELIVEGKDHKITKPEDAEDVAIFDNQSKSNVILKGGVYEAKTESYAMIYNRYGGTISIYDSVFRELGTENSGFMFSNSNSTLNIYSGTIDGGMVKENKHGSYSIYSGMVNIYGGMIHSQRENFKVIDAETVNFIGGTISDSDTAISCRKLSIGEDATFKNNKKDILIGRGSQFDIFKKGDIYTDSEGQIHKITKNWSGIVKVYVTYLMDYNIKYPITTSGISEDMLDHVISANENYIVKYDKEDQYLYLWRHVHQWNYSSEDQVITVNCTSDPDCIYEGEITAILIADDVIYDEDSLDPPVIIENDISAITGAKATLLYVGRDGTEYEETEKEPTDAGKYTARFMIAGEVVSADFEIFKAEQEAPDLTSEDETIFGKSDGKIKDVNSRMEYRTDHKDYEAITATSLSGLKPGTYYVRYKGTKNYEPSEETKIVIKEGRKASAAIKGDQITVKKITNMGLKIKQSAKQIKVSYNKIPNASGYDVYIQYCQYKFNKKSLVSVKNAKTTNVLIKKINGKKVDSKQNYKIYVVAYQKINGKKQTIAKSITVHIAGRKSKKYTNVKTVKVSKTAYRLKKGQSVKIKAKAVLQDSKKKQLGNDHAKQFRYVTNDKTIAFVTKSGKIKALKNGTCDIYVYARNGCAKKIKVTVK